MLFSSPDLQQVSRCLINVLGVRAMSAVVRAVMGDPLDLIVYSGSEGVPSHAIPYKGNRKSGRRKYVF